ncbi:MAG: bifunctional transcriptional activator/DNA repair enzyme AdaA, partial [Paracoccus sp. (in: a-proteobacteria)]
MRDLPDHDRLYAALLARDASYDGRALVGVATTGIFCRLSCPARKPRPENCRWFADADAAQAAGFRPCRRCDPLSVGPQGHAVIAMLTAALAADPTRRWSEADLTARGLDPSTVRRLFRVQFGQSFLSMARAARLRQGMSVLQQGAAVIEAQLDAGFESATGFRQAFRRLFGHAPDQMRGAGVALADWIDTPLGGMIVIADADHLHLLEFVERKALPQGLRRLSVLLGGRIGLGRTAVHALTEAALAGYMAGHAEGLDLPVALHG